ncbi:MAG: glycosyltransferase family 4 protein [Bacteroidales bacterium]|nr:glycosyltransferase family 4 protein [Bacteroidales bacterium]
MRIGIEGQRLFREKKHGMEIVALELIKELQKLDHENEYFIYVKPDVDNDCIQSSKNFHIVPVESLPFPFWEQSALAKAAQKDGCNLLHCTSNTAPLNPGLPLIITLHDIIYLEKSYFNILADKGTYYQRFGNIYRKIIVPRIIKKASKIITVSHFEKNRISDYFGYPADSDFLHTVYNGVSNHFKIIEDENFLKRVKIQYNLPDQYIFFLGNTAPKKNTTGVLQAFCKFKSETNFPHKLVMLDFDRHELKKLLKEIGNPKLENEIHLAGYVVNTDLPAIYALSSVFLYPSLRESFGIPVLEAMKCGTPVITSNTSSMPEVSGGAAITIDPYKPSRISEALVLLLENDKLRNELIEKGYSQAAGFSWRKMAENVLRLYKEVYENNK